MIEAVENHMPQVIVIDEIGTELEAAAARTIAERGVQLIGTAHGNNLDNLMLNPTLTDLIGGIQSVTLGDEEARRRRSQKSVLERKAPPTFDVVVEIQSRDRVTVHADVADTVDAMLRGDPIAPELRLPGSVGAVQRSQSRPRPGPQTQMPGERFGGLVGAGGNWRTERRMLAGRFGLGTGDTVYVSMPMFHSNAIMAGWAVGLAAGATIALRRRFSASGFLPDIRALARPTANYVGRPPLRAGHVASRAVAATQSPVASPADRDPAARKESVAVAQPAVPLARCRSLDAESRVSEPGSTTGRSCSAPAGGRAPTLPLLGDAVKRCGSPPAPADELSAPRSATRWRRSRR